MFFAARLWRKYRSYFTADTLPRLVTSVATFNSLFEMPLILTFLLSLLTAIYSFNSLFEMLAALLKALRRSGGPLLSILYLRCNRSRTVAPRKW